MNLTIYANVLRKSIAWPSWFALCEKTKMLNKPTERFVKGVMREKALETYSNGRFLHVNEIGYDNIDTIQNTKLEFKTAKLLTSKGKKKKFISARIKNTMGNSGAPIIQKADVYIFGGCDGVVICDFDTIATFLERKNDAITCKVPFECVVPVVFASDCQQEIDYLLDKVREIDYKSMEKNIMTTFLEKLK